MFFKPSRSPSTTTWMRRAVAALCLAIAAATFAPAGAQPPGPPPTSPPAAQSADAPAATRPPPPPPALTITTSSLLQHKLGEWSTLDIRATNPTSEPKEAFVSILFEGGQRQYARRLWVPANGDRTTWLPIKVPADATAFARRGFTSLTTWTSVMRCVSR